APRSKFRRSARPAQFAPFRIGSFFGGHPAADRLRAALAKLLLDAAGAAATGGGDDAPEAGRGNQKNPQPRHPAAGGSDSRRRPSERGIPPSGGHARSQARTAAAARGRDASRGPGAQTPL